MKSKVELTVFEWHQILKILENEFNTVNAGRFTGISNEQIEFLYIKMAEQLAGHNDESPPG